MIKKKVLILFLSIFLISLTSASSFGYNYLDQGAKVQTGGNYSINVNNSQYFQSYTPTTLGNWLQSTFNWITNSVSTLTNYYSKTDINNFNASYLNTTNASYVPYTGANQNVNLGNNNFDVNSSTLYVNSTSGRVGIGTTSPSNLLQVSGTSLANGEVARFSNTNSDSYITIGNGITGITGGYIRYDYTNHNIGIGTWGTAATLTVSGGTVTFPGMAPAASLVAFQDSTPTIYGYIGKDTNAFSGALSGSMGIRAQGAMHLGTNGNNIKMTIDTNGNVGIGTTNPLYKLSVGNDTNTNYSLISAYFEGNISSAGYLTRTSVFDKSENAFDYIKDADAYIGKSREINHSAFYGYTTYNLNVTDYSKPVNVSSKEYNETSRRNETIITTTYPYTKIIKEEAVNMGMEIDVLRQGLYEANERVKILESENIAIKNSLCKLGETQWCIGVIK